MSTRKKGSLEVTGYNGSIGNYTISIRKIDENIDLLNSEKTNTQNETLRSQNRSIGESILLPEYLGEMIVGTVVDKSTNEPVESQEVVLSILSDEMHQDIVKTNAKGVFYFHLKQNYKKEDAVLQIADDNEDAFKILLQDNNNWVDYGGLQFKDFQLTESMQKEIRGRSIQNQIENAYYEVKQDTVLQEPYPKPFFGNFYQEYILDDFKRFKTVEETLVEVVDDAWSRRSDDDRREINVREREFDPYYGEDIKPMIIVDGIFVQDHQMVLDFDAAKVKSIKVYRQEYYFNKKVFQGILLVQTFDNNFADFVSGNSIKRFVLSKPISKKKYFNPSYSREITSNLSRIPDYRNQLLWVPNFNLNKRVNVFDFYTSDVKGDFQIILEGFNTRGEPIKVTDFFTVK